MCCGSSGSQWRSAEAEPASADGWVLAQVGATIIAVFLHVIRVRAIRSLAAALDAAENRATSDVLTGLHNRRGLLMVGEEVLALARRGEQAVSCTFIDVDGLKAVNDDLGHEAGDRLLVAVADAVGTVFRESDVRARWGGDEFAVLAVGSGPTVEDVERRIGGLLRVSYSAGNSGAGVSAGRVVHMPWEDEGVSELLERADQEMYRRRRMRRARHQDHEQV